MKAVGPLGTLQHDLQNRGVSAWLLSAALFGFYFALYFGPYSEISDPQGPYEHFQAFLWPFTEILKSAGDSIFAAMTDGPGFWIFALLSIGTFAGVGGYFLYLARDNKFSLGVGALAYAIVLFGVIRFVQGVAAVDAQDVSGSGRWFLYGTLYTIAITIGGVYMIWRYKHNQYQIVRTLIVMLVQITFGFSIPVLLLFFQKPEFYFSYLWPLKIDYLDPKNFGYYGEFFILYSFFGSLVMVPIMTVLFGKRWYCSWVCGCGGLANTFGEPWRHLSDKSSRAWFIEKITIHTVLILAFVSTAIWFASALFPDSTELSGWATWVRDYYGIVVVAALSGAAGVGLYPIAGTRFWCRFFCPMAALLGLIQKIGRFRIRVKKDMCISCGMCSKYCEMGIDVRAYAQANKSFTRASCVGCGLCSEVCPRGVLRLENALKRDPQELSLESFINETWKGDSTTIGARE